MLSSYTFKVAVLSKAKLIQVNSTTIIRETILDKVDTEYTKILAQALGFSYKFLVASDGEFGRPLHNGSWTGMVGMVLRHEADMIISVLSVTEERKRVLDFSYPFYRTRITFATRKPEYEPDSLVLIKPFSFQVWICIMISLLLMILILHQGLKRRYSLQKITLSTFSNLLNQNVDISPKNVSESLLILSWTIGATFFANFYTAVLLSSLTLPRLVGVRTIPELAAAVKQGKYECLSYPGTFFPGVLAAASDPNFKMIGLSLSQNNGSYDVDGVLSNTKSTKKSAFVLGTDHLLAFADKYFISEDEFFPAMPAIAMRKDFCCKSAFDNVVSYIWVSGIYSKLVADVGFEKSLKILLSNANTAVSNVGRALTITDIQGALLILMLGYVLGIILLLLEITTCRTCKLQCNRHK